MLIKKFKPLLCFWHLLFVAVAIGLLWFFVPWPVTLTLENFTNVQGEAAKVSLDLSGGKYIVAKKSFDKRPVNINPEVRKLQSNSKNYIGFTNESGIVNLKLDQEKYNQSNLIVFMKPNSRHIAGYIEVLRQSPSDLKRMYNFDQPTGYNVLGRTSINLPKKTDKVIAIRESLDPALPDITAYYPNEEKKYPIEIEESVAIIKMIWDNPLNIGPNNNQDYEKFSAIEKLKLLQESKWSAQCAGIRNIFKEFAVASTNINEVRDVNLYQYYPEFPDLITNSHAVVEIYSKELNKWVMIDPFFASIFMQDDNYLNAQDIASMDHEQRKKIKNLNFVPSRSIENIQPDLDINLAYYVYFGTVHYGAVFN